MPEPYDEVNQKDFDDNTDKINEALEKIERDNSLKPTIATLSTLTGFHRNTLRNRGWPVDRINKLKDRNTELKKIELSEKKVVKKELIEKLDDAVKEIAFWFKKYKDLERDYLQMDIQKNRFRESQNHYIEENRAIKQTLKTAIDQLELMDIDIYKLLDGQGYDIRKLKPSTL